MQPSFHQTIFSPLKRLVIWNVLLFFALFSGLTLFFINQFGLPERLNFQGHSWEYQTIAINLLHGHGYRPGIVEPFDSYFSVVTPNTTHRQWGAYPEEFYRTPGYPLYIVLAYLLFGQKAESLILFQYLSFSMICALLPWLIGRVLKFGWVGYLAGLITIVHMIKMNYFLKEMPIPLRLANKT